MRTVFFVLLLANLALFAWTYLASASVSGEGQLMQQQIRPEAIRLLTPEQVAQAAQTAKQAAAKQMAQQAALKPPEPVKVVACVELGSFNIGDVTKVEQALEPLSLGARVSQRRVDEVAGYWVYVPPQRSRQVANQKTAELKRLGVDEFFVVQDDPKLRYAISLGVFKSEEAAKARLDQLRSKGVRSARIGSRETQVQKVFFTVRDIAEPVVGKLNDLRQGFPGTELKDCQPETRRAAPA